MNRLRLAYHILRRAGLVIGPLLFFGPLLLDALELASIGMPRVAWEAIGGSVFFSSGIAIIWSQQIEQGRMKKAVESRRAVAESDSQLATLIDEGTALRAICNQTGYDATRERQFYASTDDWETCCQDWLGGLSPSLAAGFRSEGANLRPTGRGDVQDRCNSLWQKLDYLKHIQV